jgi:hypothetical protein
LREFSRLLLLLLLSVVRNSGMFVGRWKEGESGGEDNKKMNHDPATARQPREGRDGGEKKNIKMPLTHHRDGREKKPELGRDDDEADDAGLDARAGRENGLREDVRAGESAEQARDDIADADGDELVVDAKGLTEVHFDRGDVEAAAERHDKDHAEPGRDLGREDVPVHAGELEEVQDRGGVGAWGSGASAVAVAVAAAAGTRRHDGIDPTARPGVVEAPPAAQQHGEKAGRQRANADGKSGHVGELLRHDEQEQAADDGGHALDEVGAARSREKGRVRGQVGGELSGKDQPRAEIDAGDEAEIPNVAQVSPDDGRGQVAHERGEAELADDDEGEAERGRGEGDGDEGGGDGRGRVPVVGEALVGDGRGDGREEDQACVLHLTDRKRQRGAAAEHGLVHGAGEQHELGEGGAERGVEGVREDDVGVAVHARDGEDGVDDTVDPRQEEEEGGGAGAARF